MTRDPIAIVPMSLVYTPPDPGYAHLNMYELGYYLLAARMLSLGVMTPAVASLQSEFYKRSARN